MDARRINGTPSPIQSPYWKPSPSAQKDVRETAGDSVTLGSASEKEPVLPRGAGVTKAASSLHAPHLDATALDPASDDTSASGTLAKRVMAGFFLGLTLIGLVGCGTKTEPPPQPETSTSTTLEQVKTAIEGMLDEGNISQGNREVAQKALDYLFKVAQERGGSMHAKGEGAQPGKELTAVEAYEALGKGESVMLKAGKDAPVTEIHNYGELAGVYKEVLKAVGQEVVDQGVGAAKSEIQKRLDEYLKKMGLTDNQKEMGEKALDYLAKVAKEKGGAFYDKAQEGRRELAPLDAYRSLQTGRPIWFQAVKDGPAKEIRNTGQLVETYKEVITATLGDEVKKGEDTLGDLLQKKLDELLGRKPTEQPGTKQAPQAQTPLETPAGAPVKEDEKGQNQVEVKVGGKETFTAAKQMIKGAKSQVQLEMYELQHKDIDGSTAIRNTPGNEEQQAIVPLLVEEAKRGIKVQVLLDQSREGADKVNNEKIAQYLKSNGVDVRLYPRASVNIDHVKLLVVDGRQVLIGGVNFSSRAPAAHDADVLISGPAAKTAQNIFEQDWKYAGGDNTASPRVAQDPASDVLFATTSPAVQGGGASDIKSMLLKTIEEAKTSIHVEMYVLNSEEVVDALIRAKERGVDVKVILDATQERVNAEPHRILNESGVPARWFDHEKAGKIRLHGKWGVADNQSTIVGSANWSYQGLHGGGDGKGARGNKEMNVKVKSGEVSSAFERQFQNDWEHATR